MNYPWKKKNEIPFVKFHNGKIIKNLKRSKELINKFAAEKETDYENEWHQEYYVIYNSYELEK